MFIKIKNKLLNSIKKINDSYEFKPLLSEIEEAPVSPLGRFTFWTLVALIVVTTLWLFIGQVDIVVNARGIIVPDGDAKIIQPLDTGVVRQILIKEGDFVKKGQLLIAIDTSTTDAQLQTINKNLEQSKLEAQRLKASGNGEQFNSSNNETIEEFEVQKKLYEENLLVLKSSIGAKEQEIVQLNRQIDSTIAQKRDYEFQLKNAQEREKRLANVIDIIAYNQYEEAREKLNSLKIHVKNLRHENVKGDTQRIKQVLMNILSNAIKYTPENGRITIEIYEKDPHNGIGNYQFVFEDNGRGMKPEFLDKIFEPFERASDDEIKRIQGTGLGMSISHKIIQMMGGDIKVESEYGKGSRFTIDMPLVCRDQKPDDKIEVEGLEVLVVDDDKIACLNTSSCLQEIGINSECVYSGSEAIEKVRQHLAEKEYFAVIIDLKMPQMNGIETTRQIRRFVGADVPIIILSAYDLEEYEAEAKEVKANGFITKPLYKSKLLQVLRSFLDEGDQPEPIRPFKLSNVDYSGKRILLVEDNELNREIAVEIIGSTGITIDTAINGLDAVHKVAQSEEGFYQIILMDIQMPIMDGYEATRQIRSLQRRDIAHMPIIAMTANAFSEDVTNAIKAGMNYHLAKPIDIGALMGILSKYLQAPA